MTLCGGIRMVYFWPSLVILPGFTLPLPVLFLHVTGMDKPLQNFSCNSSASRTVLRLLLPGVQLGGMLIDLLSHRISTDLQSWPVYFSVMSPLCFPMKELFLNLGFMGLCSLQYIGISSSTWEMTHVFRLFSYPLKTNENSLSCHSSSTWLHRSKGNSHMNMKVYGKGFSMLHCFEIAISPCAIRPKAW